jgi:soluble lytic murein transglycosylase-like protein
MRFILYFLLLIASPALADQAADFLAAHDAFLAGDTVKLGRYAQRLKKTPLEVYVSYYQLSLNLKSADAKLASNSDKGPVLSSVGAAVTNFLSRPEDTPLIDQLRSEWLKLLGKKQLWNLFDAEYPRLLNEDTELTCYALQSRRRNQELAVLRETRKLWFTGKGQPDSCGTLFEAALSAGIISEQDVRRRLRLALEANNVTLAIKLAEQPNVSYSSMSAMLKSAATDPDHYLKKLTPSNSNSTNGLDMAATQAPVSVAIEAPVSGIEQTTSSDRNLETPPPSQSATTTPSTERSGWGNFLSMFGFGKAGNSSPATTDDASPPSSASSSGASEDLPKLSNPPSATTNVTLTPPPVIPTSDSPGSGCEASCVDMSDDETAPPMGWNSKLTSKSQRTVALFALQRLARQSSDLAAARWAKIAGYFPVNEQHYFYGWLAYEAARNLDPRALQWYKTAANTPLDDHQSAWRVRAAIRAQDWHEVLSSVNAMSEQQQHNAAWQYWKARALQALGKPIEARKIFAPLSGEFHFYGQMASAELTDFPVLSETIPAYKPDKQAITEMMALPGIQRTLALYRMGLRSEALEEWRWVLRNLNDRELLTAAEIAKRNEMYDRAIGAAEKTVNVHDFSLRYLAPYRSELQAHIREHGLDEAWVYGLMRQESRFATNATSDTGASGLMQIMPATARWVASKLGLRSYRNALIHQLDTNLRIGTYYMKSVLSQSENNPVLASAAYNAGPIRALQWRGDRPLEGAIYAETIPFEETRDYVKKVMSNTVYYADQFGNPPRSLKQRLGTIAAKSTDNKAATQNAK